MSSLNTDCRHPECDKIGTHRLYLIPGDGFRYSILHCEKHLDWAKETMGEYEKEFLSTQGKGKE